jgi:hypothetical protein
VKNYEVEGLILKLKGVKQYEVEGIVLKWNTLTNVEV